MCDIWTRTSQRGMLGPPTHQRKEAMSRVEQALKELMSEKPRQMKDLLGRKFVDQYTVPLRDRLKERYAPIMDDPDACFEYGNKNAVNYGKYGYQRVQENRNTASVFIPIPRLAALIFDLPAPKGRAGCGNRWCLNPRHYTENPNKWSIRPISYEEDLSKRLVDDPEKLRQKLRDAGVLENPELAKGRRIPVRAIMSDGTVSKTKMVATKILAYLNSLDASHGVD